MLEKERKINRLLNYIDWRFIKYSAIVYILITSLLLVILLNMPNKYRAQGLYTPAESIENSSLGSLAGSLGGLAGMAGINLGGSNRDKIQMSVEIIKSKTFIYSIIADNNLAIDLFAAEDWDIEKNNILINPKLYNKKQKQWVRDVKYPKLPQPSDFELYKEFKEKLNISLDDKTKMLKISFEHYSPFFAKKVVDIIVNSINFKMQQREIKEAQTSIMLIEASIDQTEFSEVKTLLYELVQEQTKRLLLAQTKEFFVLEPIDPPVVAEEKASPKRGLILIVFTLLYGVFSLLLLVFRNKPEHEKFS